MLPSRKLLQGSASNVLRLLLSILLATVLPPLLTRHLSKPEYSAWVLILQLSTYISLLDLGLQTVIAKSVAEYHALGDEQANHRLLSSSFSLLTFVGAIGSGVVAVMVWKVPQLFHQMPADLVGQVRLSLLVIGLSSAFALPFNPFLSVFSGLQEYGFPTALALLGKLSSAALLICFVLLHASLFQLALALASINVLTAIAQFAGWRRFARDRVAFSLFQFHWQTAKTMVKSGGVLALWTIGGLFVSGLDVIIVGHFDYANTGFYAIGTTVTNFLVLIVSSLFSPLLPAVSAMQATSSPEEIGDITVRASRYCTLVVSLLMFPIFIGAFPILSLWVGHEYALKSALFLRILLLGNFIRQLGYPYSIVVIATGRQHLATLATVAEAGVNLILSLWLASKVGAVGVAIGTVAGAFVSIGLHLAVSMRLTRPAIAFSTSSFALQSLLRPLACLLPLVLLIPSWNPYQMIPANPLVLTLCGVLVLAIAWFVGLTNQDRGMFKVRILNLRTLLASKA